MCGIAGIYRFKGKPQDLGRRLEIMNRSLLHRGPDEGAVHIEPELRSGLGIRRLSIVDPEHGAQPFFSEDRSVVVVFNGEIYNHRSLRKELQAKGIRLRSHSDGEVLAHLYRQEGSRFLNRLNGMFAIALLDRNRERLLLARDRMGMKHLYWGQTEKGFVFASEVRALIDSGFVQPEPDWQSLSNFFSHGWVQSPRSAFRGISRLRAGSYLTVDSHGITEKRFWLPEFQQQRQERSLESYSEELGGLLNAAVGTHLDTDVPVGLFLSGGWDSSLVSLYASRQSESPLNSYSLQFPDDPGFDESAYFRPVAQQIGSNSREIVIRDTDVRDALQQTSLALEEPITTCPTSLAFLLSRRAGQERKVVLGGEGADELLAGYGRFNNSPLHRVRRLVPHQLVPRFVPLPLNMKWNRAFRFVSEPGEERAHLELMSTQFPDQYRTLFSKDVPFEPFSSADALGISEITRASFRDQLDLQTAVEFTGRLADGILLAIDKTAMAHSLEVRMPFLDSDVVDFALRLPSKFKVQGKAMKRVLAPLARELPENVAAREKQGLQVPSRINGEQTLRDFYRETILQTSLDSGLFDHQRLEAWVDRHFNGTHAQAARLMPVSHFCLWWNNFIRRGGP